MQNIALTKQDIDYIARVVQTEVDHSLARSNPSEYQRQVQAVVDTITNRVASPGYPNTVEGVVNQDRQFSKIAGPKSLSPFGSVQNAPPASKTISDIVSEHINERAKTYQPSIVDSHVNYGNPVHASANNVGWINALKEQTGLEFGVPGRSHYHGTTPWDVEAPPYNIVAGPYGPPEFRSPSDDYVPAIDGGMLLTPGAVFDEQNKLIGAPQFRDEVLAEQPAAPFTAPAPLSANAGAFNFDPVNAPDPAPNSGYTPSPYPAMDMKDPMADLQLSAPFAPQEEIPSFVDELATGFNPTFGLSPPEAPQAPPAPNLDYQVAPGLHSNFDAQTGRPNPGAFSAPTQQAETLGFGMSTNDMPSTGISIPGDEYFGSIGPGTNLNSVPGPVSQNRGVAAPQTNEALIDVPNSATPDQNKWSPPASPAPAPPAPAPQEVQPDVTNISVDQHGNITYGQPQQQSQPSGLFGGLLDGFVNQNNGFFGPGGLFGDPAQGTFGLGGFGNFGGFGFGDQTGGFTGGGFNGWGGGWAAPSWGGGGWSQHADPASNDGYYD